MTQENHEVQPRLEPAQPVPSGAMFEERGGQRWSLGNVLKWGAAAFVVASLAMGFALTVNNPQETAMNIAGAVETGLLAGLFGGLIMGKYRF